MTASTAAADPAAARGPSAAQLSTLLSQRAHAGTSTAARDALRRFVDTAVEAHGVGDAQPRLLHAAAQWARAPCVPEACAPGADAAREVLEDLLMRREALVPGAVAPAMAILTASLARPRHARDALASVALLAQVRAPLTQRNTKDLVAFWPQLLAPESPVLLDLLVGDVRKDAAAALAALLEHGQGFWAMARDPHVERRAARSAFTSHSERLADLLKYVRARVADHLGDAAARDPIPLLELVRVLVVTTERVPLDPPHAAVLWAPVVRCAALDAPSAALAAYDVLAVLHADADTYAAAAADAVAYLTALLARADAEEPLRARAWALLASFLARTELAVPPSVAPLLRRDVTSGAVAVRRGAIEMLAALARLGPRTAQVPALRTALAALVAHAAHDRAAEVRTAVCALWADVDACLAPSAPEHLAHLHALLRDADAGVRAAAVRAVGVRLEQVAAGGDAAAAAALCACFPYEDMAAVLHAPRPRGLLHDADANVRVCAAWTMANYAAVLARAPPGAEHGRALLAALVELPREEREAMHGVRALGTLLALGVRHAWFTAAGAGAAELYARGIDATCAALAAGRSPKLRWNAATSLAKALEAARGAPVAPAAEARGVAALGAALHDRTFKVQRMAAQALADVVAVRAPALEAAQRAALHAQAARARAALGARVRRASFGEAQLHAPACEAALEALLAALCGAARRGVDDSDYLA